MDHPTTPDAEVRTALRALLARNVWQDADDVEVLYVQGCGFTSVQLEAIVRQWFDAVEDGPVGDIALDSVDDDELTDAEDGNRLFVTRVKITRHN